MQYRRLFSAPPAPEPSPTAGPGVSSLYITVTYSVCQTVAFGSAGAETLYSSAPADTAPLAIRSRGS